MESRSLEWKGEVRHAMDAAWKLCTVDRATLASGNEQRRVLLHGRLRV